jgi:DNA-binding GntR family transcriptional regulator
MVVRVGRADKRIHAESLSEKIADALRKAIVDGELREGDPITQEGIAREYSVSTMPAREALLALSHEGMVDARPNRGFRVARMSKQDVLDIYWAHAVLAGRLTARACEQLTEDDLVGLEENTAQLAEALTAGNVSEVQRLNWDFHRVINTSADSPKILALLKTTVRVMPKHLYTTLQAWGDLPFRDHDSLLRALRSKDAKKAEQIAVDHAVASGQGLVSYLESIGYWTGRD